MKRSLALVVLCVLGPTASASADEAAQNAAAEKLREAGGIVMPISQADDRMEVALHLADGTVDDAMLDQVLKVPNVAWLNLAGTAVTDEGVRKLSKLEALERLHLERTAVSDGSADVLAKLPKLSYLNLYGTKVGDAGLKKLAGSKSLRKVFVWQSAVTEEAVRKANEQSDNLTVIGEVKLPSTEPAKEDAPKKPEAKKAETKPAEKPAKKEAAAEKKDDAAKATESKETKDDKKADAKGD